MAEECEGSIFVEDKKKRKRRGPRLTGVSKQRRLANARERKRVQSLNKEIEVLKSMLPLSPYEKKPTKTEVIWLAAEYISELTKMLDKAQSEEEINEPLLDFDTLLSIDIEKLLDLDGKYTLNERPLVEKIDIVSAIVITMTYIQTQQTRPIERLNVYCFSFLILISTAPLFCRLASSFQGCEILFAGLKVVFFFFFQPACI